MKEITILNELMPSCKGRTFNGIIINQYVIINTKAGQEKDGRLGCHTIFKQNLHCIWTFIAWFCFCRVLQKCINTPNHIYHSPKFVVSMCCILPWDTLICLTSLHKHQVISTTIVDPQWLINSCMCKLLMPKWYSHRHSCAVTQKSMIIAI